eukprot:jgi/Botrbrau1/5712/Bobra.0071s0043.1
MAGVGGQVSIKTTSNNSHPGVYPGVNTGALFVSTTASAKHPSIPVSHTFSQQHHKRGNTARASKQILVAQAEVRWPPSACLLSGQYWYCHPGAFGSAAGKGLPRSFWSPRRPMCAASNPEGPVPSLVTPAWLNDRLNDGRTVVLDASWYMPVAARNPKEEFKAARIPGARFFDLDKISDISSPLPHMLPKEDSFAAAADALGITNDTPVVIYDGDGLFSAPRVWWTFRTFGHKDVAVLEGGLPAWKAEGRPLETTPVPDQAIEAPAIAAANPPPSATYKAKLQDGAVRSLEQMRANLASGREVVVDARSEGRWAGRDPEPRPGLPSGHIPNSRSVPFFSLLTPSKTYRPVGELQDAFKAVGVDDDSAIVASCGTGVTACILVLALHQIYPNKEVAVYDGSWTEWGSLPDTPKGSL